MNLEQAAQSLLEQFPAGDGLDLVRRERRLERLGKVAFGGFGVVLILAVCGMIYAILTKFVFAGDQPWVGLLLIAFLIFAVLSLAYVVFREDLKEKRQKTRSAALEMPAVTGRLLEEKQFEPIPAVTESTTDLLPRENTKKF